MPREHSSGAAVRTPGLRKLAHPTLAGLFGEPENAPDRDLHREVPGGPYIPSAFGKKQVDLGRPAADPLDADELPDSGFISFS